MDYLQLLGNFIGGGVAALGFGILFNVTPRTLLTILILGALGVVVRTVFIELNVEIIIASFFAAATIGLLCQLFAVIKKSPPLLIAIPAIIPLIPGIYLYQMMIGLIELSADIDKNAFLEILSQTLNNGLKAIFILLSLSFGISLPYLLFRKDTFNYIKISENLHKKSTN